MTTAFELEHKVRIDASSGQAARLAAEQAIGKLTPPQRIEIASCIHNIGTQSVDVEEQYPTDCQTPIYNPEDLIV
jgi:hypothetical protein